MTKIIYKEGFEGQNKLSCIEGIEIVVFGYQRALIFPSYKEDQLLTFDKRELWKAPEKNLLNALKERDIAFLTGQLLALESPAALWASQFKSEKHGQFCFPNLLVALEIQQQRERIDALAQTIEGADLLKDHTHGIWSCSRNEHWYQWIVNDNSSACGGYFTDCSCLVVPTILLG